MITAAGVRTEPFTQCHWGLAKWPAFTLGTLQRCGRRLWFCSTSFFRHLQRKSSQRIEALVFKSMRLFRRFLEGPRSDQTFFIFFTVFDWTKRCQPHFPITRRILCSNYLRIMAIVETECPDPTRDGHHSRPLLSKIPQLCPIRNDPRRSGLSMAPLRVILAHHPEVANVYQELQCSGIFSAESLIAFCRRNTAT